MSDESWTTFHEGRRRQTMLAVAVIAFAALACAGPPAPRTRADPAVSLLESLRAASAGAAAPTRSAIRGEEVACFLEDRAASGGTIDRAAFEAWRGSRGSEPALDAAEGGASARTISRLRARLEPTLLEKGVETPARRITFGTAPTGKAPPSVFALPATDARLVVFDDRLFDMVYAVVSAGFDAGPIQGGAGCVAETQEARDEHSAALARPRLSVALRYFAGAARSGRYDVAPAQAASVLAMVRVAELFALGHEYAHVLLGHEASTTAGRPATAGAFELSYGTGQEMAADELAFRLVQETIARDGTDAEKAMAPFGPDVMLHVLDLLETARAVFDGRMRASAPTALGRRLWPAASGASDAPGGSRFAGESSLAARRAAMREHVRAVATGPDPSSRDPASLVSQTTACLFGTVAPGLASAGERRRGLREPTANAANTHAGSR